MTFFRFTFGLLVVAFLLVLPLWPYSQGWGFQPGVGVGTIALLVGLLHHGLHL